MPSYNGDISSALFAGRQRQRTQPRNAPGGGDLSVLFANPDLLRQYGDRRTMARILDEESMRSTGERQIHATPDEMRLLKQRGGAGSPHPVTGLPSYVTSGDADHERSSRERSGHGQGRGGLSGPGRGDRGSDRATTTQTGRPAAPALSRPAAPAVSRPAAPAQSSTRAPHEMRPSQTMVANYKERSLGQPMSAQVDPKTGGFRMGNTSEGFDLGGAVAAGASLLSPPIGAALSVANKLTGSPLTVGGGWSAAEQGDLSGSGNLSEPGSDRSGRDGLTRSLTSGRAMNQPALAAPGFARPAARAIPAGMRHFLSSQMTPLQMRTGVATMGTQGIGASDSDAFSFYKNLLERDFISDSGEPLAYGGRDLGLMPVEEQYLRDIFGLQFEPDTRSLLAALAGYGGA